MFSSVRCLLLVLFTVATHFVAYGAAQSHIFRLRGNASYAELSFRMEQNLIIIPLTIGDSLKMNFILDTGTESPVILNRKYIEDLDLPLGRDVDFQGAGKKDMTRGQVINNMQIQIGDAYADRIGGVVLNKNTLSNLRINGIRIHGIIGASLFRSFAVEIDYPNHRLRLHQDNSFREYRSFSVQTMLISQSRPILSSTLKSRGQRYDVNLMIDTGLNDELVLYDPSRFNYARLSTDKVGKGYCGNVIASSVQLETLEVAGLQFREVNTMLLTTTVYQAKYKYIRDRDGTIGNKLLMDYCVVLDYANSTFYVESSDERLYYTRFIAEEKW